jgi:hypothetical protein
VLLGGCRGEGNEAQNQQVDTQPRPKGAEIGMVYNREDYTLFQYRSNRKIIEINSKAKTPDEAIAANRQAIHEIETAPSAVSSNDTSVEIVDTGAFVFGEQGSLNPSARITRVITDQPADLRGGKTP